MYPWTSHNKVCSAKLNPGFGLEKHEQDCS